MEFFLLSMDGSDGGSMWSLFGSFLYIMLVLAFIILVCWFILRLTGRVRKRGSASGNLYLVESILVSAQNVVQIVKAGDKYLVIGVTKERITLLSELDAEQIKEITPNTPIGASFSKVLERFMPPKDKGDEDGETQE